MIRSVLPLLLLLGCAEPPAVGVASSPVLDAAVTTHTTDAASALAFADYDGDGDLDLAYGTGASVQLMLGDGAGSFTDSVLLSAGQSVTGLAWGDPDADGLPELAVCRDGAPPQIWTDMASIPPTAGPTLQGSFACEDLVWADVNGDGDLDLVEGTSDDGLRVHLNDGSNLDGSVFSFVATSDVRGVDAGDVDGDGVLDLAVGHAGAVLELRLGPLDSTDPCLDLSLLCTDDVLNARSVRLVDQNGDGRLDVVVGQDTEPAASFGGLGLGNDSPGWETAEVMDARAIAPVDADMDGHVDLIVGTEAGTDDVFLGTGAGLDVDPSWQTGVGATQDLAWADVDNDGDLDLTVARDSGVHTYLREAFGLPATEALTPTHGATSVSWGDLDGDGDPDAVVGGGTGFSVYLNDGGQLSENAA